MKFFSKKLQADFSLTFPGTDSAVHIFLGRVLKTKTTFFYLVSKLAKITFHIYMALKKTVFVYNVCYSSSVNGNFKVQKKRSMWHISAFIYSLSGSIQQLFFRHER